MKNGLIPEKRLDVNGKLTTRWVKSGADGKPVPRGIPAPKSTTAKETASRIRMTLFPESQTFDDRPDEEYAVNMRGVSTFYSSEFAQQTIERIPVRTLKALESTLDELPDGVAKQLVVQCVYDLIAEMYDMGDTAAAPHIMKEQSRMVSNACFFSGVAQALARVEDHRVSDYMFLLDQSLGAYENGGFHRQNPVHSDIDYGALPIRKAEEARNYVMADQLHRHYGNPVERLPEAALELPAEYEGQWERLTEVARQRGFSDLGGIRAVMDSEVAALSEGAL